MVDKILVKILAKINKFFVFALNYNHFREIYSRKQISLKQTKDYLRGEDGQISSLSCFSTFQFERQI
jgi:hypothetical protein